MNQNKIILTVTVATLFAASLVTTASAATTQIFTDVSASTPHYTAMAYLKAHGVISGYPDGSFKPTQPISRVEALKLILTPQFKHWDKTNKSFLTVPSTSVSFKDTDKAAWYWTYIQQGHDNNLVQGYSDGTFKPASSVNTAENLKMLLTRYFEDNTANLNNFPTTLKFSDEQGGAWYVEYLNAAGTMHILDAGVSGNGFPGNQVSRAEFSEMVYRLMKMDDDGSASFDESHTPTADLSTTGTATSSTSSDSSGSTSLTGGTFTAEGYSFKLPSTWTYVKTQNEETIQFITIQKTDPQLGTITDSIQLLPAFSETTTANETLLQTTSSGAKIYTHSFNHQCAVDGGCLLLQSKGTLYVVEFGRPTDSNNNSAPASDQITADEALSIIASLK